MNQIVEVAAGHNSAQQFASSHMGESVRALTARIKHLNERPKLGSLQIIVLICAALLSVAVIVQAEEKVAMGLGVSASSSLTVNDDGSYLLELENAHYGAAVQMLSSLGSLHVLAHPEINTYRISTNITGTTEKWMDGVMALVNADPAFGDVYGVKVENRKLLLASKEDLQSGNRDWLDEALVLGSIAPAPKALEATRVSANVTIEIDNEATDHSGLILADQAWFGIQEGKYEVNIRPTILENDQILLDVRIHVAETGEPVATPSLLTLSGRDAVIDIGDDDRRIKVSILPNLL